MIRIKNNTGGYYSLQLEDSTGIKPDKFFIFPLPTTELAIPDDYAKSIAFNPYAIEAYRTGLFVVTQGQAELDQILIDSGSYDDKEVKEIKDNITPDAMLLAALRNGTVEKVMSYYESPNRDRLIQLAVDHCSEVASDKIDALEKASGLSIKIED